MLEDIQSWFQRRVPEEWFTAPIEVTADGEEILVFGTLPDPGGESESEDARAAAQAAAIRRFREESRQRRRAPSPARECEVVEELLQEKQHNGTGPDSAEREALDAYSSIVTSVAERVLPSVASLRIERQTGRGSMGGSGSGIAITEDGVLL